MPTPALHPRALTLLVLALAGACGRGGVGASEPAGLGPSTADAGEPDAAETVVVPEGMEGWAHLLGHNTPYQSRTNWKGQRREGPITLWHPSGGKQGEGSYDADGRRTGPWVFWYENGQKRWEGTYEKDAVVGLERAWYEDGTPHYEATYVDGLMEGECSYWHPTGRLMWKGHFERGQRHGSYLEWTATGELDEEASGTYVRGKKVAEAALPAAGIAEQRR
jgi:hypothetical protein